LFFKARKKLAGVFSFPLLALKIGGY